MVVYPTTNMMAGKETAQDVIDSCVTSLIEEYYYARRFSADDIVELAELARDKINQGD